MKIAMIGHKRVPSREGGIEIVVEEISTRMARQGHDVTVYNRTGHHVSGKTFDPDQGRQLKTYKGVRVKKAFTIQKKGLAAATSSFFATIKALFGKYDCIHYHAEGPSVMLCIPHLLGLRTVVTIHGLDWQRGKWDKFATWYLKLGEKTAVRYANEVIVLSKSMQRYFMQQYGRSTVFIPNGVEKPPHQPVNTIRSRWGLEKDSYICFLSRIVPEKGLQYLIEAFRGVQTDKSLVVAGGSSDTEGFFEQMRHLAAADTRVIFTDFVCGQALAELYSNAYVYVLPSDLEGMPLGLLEAMSYGNCCVVSDIAECTEVVEDQALTFSRGDVAALRQKLQMLCDDQAVVEQYKRNASDFICRKYQWDDIVVETLNLYRKSGK